MSSSVAPTGTVAAALPTHAAPSAAEGAGSHPQLGMDPSAVILVLVENAAPALTQTPLRASRAGGGGHSLDFYA